jgi:signal peptidase II
VSRRGTALRAAAVAAAVLVADQVTKALVRAEIARGEQVELLPGVNLVHTRNRGIAFGLLSGGGVLLAVVAALVLGGLLAYLLTHLDRRGVWLATGLLFAGALGNMIDRVRQGWVTDFIDLPLWPAFNVADIAITAGVIVLFLVLQPEADHART